jgi:hypothetical protein
MDYQEVLEVEVKVKPQEILLPLEVQVLLVKVMLAEAEE